MRIIPFSFILLIAFTGCYSPRYVYSPPTQNIPILAKKNDVTLATFYAGSLNAFKEKGNYNRGFDMQSAWAISKHFAVLANESIRSEKNGGNASFYPNDSSFLSYKRSFTEFGAGYIASPAYNRKMQFQVFGGAAFGSSKIFDNYISNNIKIDKYHYSHVTKIFVQPALVYSFSKNFFSALSSRFTEVLFSHIRTNYTATELDNYILDSIGIAPVFFWEPSASYTFGFKKIPVKIQVQGSITVLLNHRFIEHRNTNVGIGLFYSFLKPKNDKRAVSTK